MRPPLTPAQQHALVTYCDELKQAEYRLILLREAERDMKNKKSDYEMAHERSEAALVALIAECHE
jgi:hypothetical protein